MSLCDTFVDIRLNGPLATRLLAHKWDSPFGPAQVLFKNVSDVFVRRGASFHRVLRLIRSQLSPQHNFLRRIKVKTVITPCIFVSESGECGGEKTETSISFSNRSFIFSPISFLHCFDPLTALYTSTDLLTRCVIGVAENSEDVMKMLTGTQKHNFQFIQN
ncbi:hypothetical protein F6Q06_21570 [Pectobacterium parmentieri]|uniref:Uncharacterized protein n=1 Tax=Pectobacterium parmentieri TaxID=1905730 RepID=A0ABS0S5B3_PECPM|nr:hypothetical protein [Pectobacterium parmentieri]MBI0557051.1 hypothetical protein [Pectobacterium parmentieri]